MSVIVGEAKMLDGELCACSGSEEAVSSGEEEEEEMCVEELDAE